MTTLRRLFFIPLFLLMASCQIASNREASRAQALLDEADLLIEGRQLTQAQEKAEKALNKITTLPEGEGKTRIDFKLLEVRAQFTLFMSRNLLTLERADVRRRSLVRFPRPGELLGQDTQLAAAEKTLREVASSHQELTPDQQGFIHGMLGAILRLDESKLDEADREYGQAITVYKKQLQELEANPPKIGTNESAVALLQNQIRSLQMAQAEVNLLAEDWTDALDRLESVMAGDDLQYFAVQFEILNNSIADAKQQLEQAESLRQGSREANLVQALEEKRKKNKSKREELGSYNPHRMMLTQAKIQATDTVNNLMYRMICYRNLNKKEEYEEARQILESFYPSLTNDLEAQLRRYG